MNSGGGVPSPQKKKNASYDTVYFYFSLLLAARCQAWNFIFEKAWQVCIFQSGLHWEILKSLAKATVSAWSVSLKMFNVVQDLKPRQTVLKKEPMPKLSWPVETF